MALAITRQVTSEKEAAFLEQLRLTGNVTASARTIGNARKTFYLHRDQDSEFAAAWDEALLEATDALEAEVRRRGHDGWDEPIFYQGQMVATVRKYSDTLLIFLLKAHNDKFKDHARVDLGGQRENPVQLEAREIAAKLSPEAQEKIQKILAEEIADGRVKK